MGYSKSSQKKEVQGNKCPHEKTRKVLKKQPNFTAQGARKRIKPKVSRGEEIAKIRAELNEIVTKNTIQKMNKIKSWFSKR